MKILLREVMIEKDITYQELAKRSGVSKSHRIVCGQMYTPIEYLEKIAKSLNIKITDLFDSDYK